MTFDELLVRFEKPVGMKDGSYVVHCPAHDDKKSSLSMKPGDYQVAQFHCFAGCSEARILDALGIAKADLALKGKKGGRVPKGFREVAGYIYTDEHGIRLYQSVRYEKTDERGDYEKTFKVRRLDANGQIVYNLNETRRVLYNLPAILKADTVFIVEGEKDVDHMGLFGLVATTNVFGAGKWSDEYSKALAGKHVVVIADNDEPGRAHAAMVAASVAGHAASVKVIDGARLGVPIKGDVSDFFIAGGTTKQLLTLVVETPVYDGPITVTASDDAVTFDALNRRFFIVDVGSRPCVGEEVTVTDDRERTYTTFVFRSYEHFRDKFIKARNDDGNLADRWLSSKQGRQFEKLVYTPPGARVNAGPKDLQGWRGFTVDPAPGDWSLTKAFIRDVICSNNESLFEWTLDWLADLFQRPGLHAETGLVLTGAQGIGKNFFADMVIHDCFNARHARTVHSPNQALGEFNDVVSGLCVLTFDEVELSSAQRKRVQAMMTASRNDINRKGLPLDDEWNMLHLLFLSNSPTPIGIDRDDRRFAFYDVSAAHQNDTAYFKGLLAELTHGGRAAMLHELLSRPVDRDATLRLAPITAAKIRAKQSAMTPLQLWLQELLDSHTPETWRQDERPETDRARQSFNGRIVKKETLIRQCLDWLGARRIALNQSDANLRQTLGYLLAEHCPAGWNASRQIKIGGRVTRDYWTLPALDAFRTSFAKARGIVVETPEPAVDGEPLDLKLTDDGLLAVKLEPGQLLEVGRLGDNALDRNGWIHFVVRGVEREPASVEPALPLGETEM
jgi:hypothetical protein